MNKDFSQFQGPISDFLRTLIGFHRQLLEIIRTERRAIASADREELIKVTDIKVQILEGITKTEAARLKLTEKLANDLKTDPLTLTIEKIILGVQERDPKGAENLRSASQTLSLLIKRIQDQNKENKALIERSLFHVNEMKRNVLREANPSSNIYSAQGQKITGSQAPSKNSRLIFTEG